MFFIPGMYPLNWFVLPLRLLSLQNVHFYVSSFPFFLLAVMFLLNAPGNLASLTRVVSLPSSPLLDPSIRTSFTLVPVPLGLSLSLYMSMDADLINASQITKARRLQSTMRLINTSTFTFHTFLSTRPVLHYRKSSKTRWIMGNASTMVSHAQTASNNHLVNGVETVGHKLTS
ncbi:hypothetical protein J3F83DRAFT_255735 [Trichoderma novae-zelandiae]